MKVSAASPAPSFSRCLGVFAATWLLVAVATAQELAPAATCGSVRAVATHGASVTRYALAGNPAAAAQDRITLVLLIGGGGNLKLDDGGCPRSLKGNVLVRSQPLFHAAGMATALVDAPSDYLADEDGLAGFRLDATHAEDLGRLISEIRERQGDGAVWLIGHSRGSISAANAGVRLSGLASPDGVVLVSPMVSGERGKRRPWAAQTVLDLDLESWRLPLLVLAHAADSCPRSLPERMGDILSRIPAGRRQLMLQGGGAFAPGRAPSLAACEVREPHDFVAQENEFAAGVVRFVRGGNY